MMNKVKKEVNNHNATNSNGNSKKTQQKQTPDIDHAYQAKIYEAFWKLSQFNQQLRMEGAQKICEFFQDTKNSDYILNRLVKGLASNRKCSRLGFSNSLTDLFNQFDSLKFETVLNLAQKNFSFQLDDCSQSIFNHNTSVLTKEEVRHMQIGLVFIYLAYIQSDRLTENEQLMQQIAKQLNDIRKNKEIKPYVQELYLQALIQMIKKVKNSKLFHKIYQTIEADLKQIFQSTLLLQNSKHDLNMLLACLNEYPKEIETNLLHKNKIDLTVLFSHENYNLIYEIISQSTELLPNIQPFCVEFIKYIVQQKTSVAKEFWSHYIDSKLCTRKEHEKKYLSFKLFLLYLQNVTIDNYEIIFQQTLLTSDNLIQTLTNNYCNKVSNLNKVSKDIIKELSDILRVKETEFSESKKTFSKLIIKFTWFAKNYHELSDLFSTTIMTLNTTGLNDLFDYLTNEFPHMSEIRDSAEEKSPKDQLVIKYMWIANQLFNMSKNVELFKDDQLVQKVLGFLVAYSYFNVSPTKPTNKTNSNLIQNSDLILIEDNEKLQNCYRDTLLKYIGILLSNHDFTSNKKIIDFIKYTQKLFKSKELPNGTKISLNESMLTKSNDYEQLTTKIVKMLTNFNQLIEKDPKLNVVHTFFIVTTLEFFRMFDSVKNSQRTVTDIEQCFQEYNSTDKNNNKNKKSDVDFNWIDVLVEILLNLLTINKTFIRVLVKNEFKKLFPILTFDSVQLIVDLLDIENDSLVADANDESDIDESDEEMEEEGVEKTNGHAKSEEESSESSSEDEQLMQLDENLKFSLEKINNDSDDSFGSDLDDETMIKMDEQYAKAFKMRKQEKTTNSSRIDYKLRVLDLIQDLFKSNTSRLDIVNFLIHPMLNILFESQKKPNLKSISQRILGFLVNFKHRFHKISEAKLPQIDDVFQTLSFIMECSAKHFNVINTLSETSMFCVKVILNIANNSNETEKEKLIDKLTNIYLEAIKCEKSKVNPMMYKGFITRYPEHSLPLIIQIIDSANINEVKIHKKIFALVTLSNTINNQTLAKKSEDTLDLFNKKISSFLERILDEIIKTEDLNIKYFDACLTLTAKVLNLQKNYLLKESCEKLASKLNLFTNEAKVKQTYKSRINKLIQLCELKFKKQ